MKKKIAILLSAIVLLLIGAAVWFHIPLDLMDLDPNKVMEIVIFNGNSGNTTHRSKTRKAFGGNHGI